MSHKIMLRWIFVFSVLIIILSGGLLVYRWPSTLTIAAGPRNSPVTAYAREIAAALEETRQPLRLKIIVTDGSIASSNLLDNRKTNLAIVRSDDETSKYARSIVVLQKKTLFAIIRKKPIIAVPKAARTQTSTAEEPVTGEPKSVAKPKKKSAKSGKEDEEDAESLMLLDVIGQMKSGRLRGGLLSRRGANDLPIIRETLEHYGLQTATGGLKTYNRKAAEDALRTGQLDFLIVMAHPSEPNVRALIRTARQALGKDFKLIAPPGAKGLAYQLKNLELSTLPAGVFGGNPPLPKTDMESVAVSYEIVATTRMSERNAAQLTKILTDLRTQLRGSDDGEFAIELPGTEEARRYLPHSGTVAQSNGESKTLLDAYSDFIWLALFGLGLAGSAITSLMTWLGIGRRGGRTET